MLPFTLLAWLFNGWKIFPQGAKSVQAIINDVVSGTVGVALDGIFVSFAVIFLNSVFGNWGGAPALQTALANNDATILMDGLMMTTDSVLTIVLMGLFIAMSMTMIPALVKTLFKVEISQKYYDAAKKNLNTVWGNMKKWSKSISK